MKQEVKEIPSDHFDVLSELYDLWVESKDLCTIEDWFSQGAENTPRNFMYDILQSYSLVICVGLKRVPYEFVGFVEQFDYWKPGLSKSQMLKNWRSDFVDAIIYSRDYRYEKADYNHSWKQVLTLLLRHLMKKTIEYNDKMRKWVYESHLEYSDAFEGIEGFVDEIFYCQEIGPNAQIDWFGLLSAMYKKHHSSQTA